MAQLEFWYELGLFEGYMSQRASDERKPKLITNKPTNSESKKLVLSRLGKRETKSDGVGFKRINGNRIWRINERFRESEQRGIMSNFILVRNYIIRQFFIPYCLFALWRDWFNDDSLFFEILNKDYYTICEYLPRKYWQGLAK